jgi:major membrane immunogen (membrane-anchored lipoprotein)
MDGVYITEDYKNRKPSFDGKIITIDKKKEFYDKAHALGQEEIGKFAKKLIEKQSNP